MLGRALNSVCGQTLSPRAVHVSVDTEREGAARTRQRALEAVSTHWTAFLDDDDAFKPEHLQILSEAARETGADYIYSWYEVITRTGQCLGNHDPVFPVTHFTSPWDPDNPRHTTMTILVRTELAQSIGFKDPEPGARYGNEDWKFTLDCVAAGAKIHHVAQRTWYWYHSGMNTSGLPKNW